MMNTSNDLGELAEMIDAGDLLCEADGSARVLIDGLLHRQDTMNIIAPMGMAPTWIGLQLAMSVATGRDWCGHACSKGKTLFIDRIYRTQTVAEMLHGVAKKMSVTPADLNGMMSASGVCGDGQALDVLLKNSARIRDGGYGAVVITGFEREICGGMKPESTSPVREAYSKVDRFEVETGCSVILVHSYYAIGEDIGGWDMDSLLNREADTHVVITPKGRAGWFGMESEMRSFAPVPRTTLRADYPILARPKGRCRHNSPPPA